MEKFIVIISLLIAGITSAYGEENPQNINLSTDKNQWGQNDRSITFPIIEAWAYTESRTIKLALHNIGNAIVRLIDTSNQVVDSASVDTSIATTFYMNANESGTYKIEIQSSAWYAEGMVTF